MNVQSEFRPQSRTNRATNTCLLGGRKAVYRADTRMLCKGCVKQTALTLIDSPDPERPRGCTEGKCADTDLEKYGVEHAKHASKLVLGPTKHNHHILNL